MIKKRVGIVVLLGAESTGKTTLAEQLAIHYNTSWLPEYGREYLERIKRPYEYKDVLYIARKQIEREDEYRQKASNYLFVDTDLINIKVWLSHVYKRCPQWVTKAITKRRYDFYLICDVDLPWKYDPVRENPHLRELLHHTYLREVEGYHFPYAIIRGTGETRRLCAIHCIEHFFTRKI